jgi:hypothetical protein
MAAETMPDRSAPTPGRRLGLIALAAVLLGAVPGWSVLGPRYLSGRALGMGDAFVALSDDYSGIYYNPAGLARLNSPMDAGMSLKFDVGDFFGTAGEALNIAGSHTNSFASLDSMSADNTLVDDIMVFDRRPIGLGSLPEMHFAARSTDPDLPIGIGAAWFLGSQGRFMLDKGIYIPAADARVRTDFVAKIAGAIQPWPGLSIGLSPTVATYSTFEQSISIQEYATASDTLQARISREKERIYRPGFGIGFTAGALYDIVPTELRVGVVAYDMFLSINNDRVPVTYSVGAAYLPAVLRKQGMLRYVNFAVDVEDVFADKDFLGKLNMGAEMNLSLAQLRGGFKGGYPCYGLMANFFIMQLEFTSWADEAGLYVGQIEDRHYMLGLRLGI